MEINSKGTPTPCLFLSKSGFKNLSDMSFTGIVSNSFFSISALWLTQSFPQSSNGLNVFCPPEKVDEVDLLCSTEILMVAKS